MAKNQRTKKAAPKPDKPEAQAAAARPAAWQLFLRRYSLVVFALLLGLGLIGASLAFAHKASSNGGSGFDVSRVLPVSMPSAGANSAVFTAQTIKQYDGKDGHLCYVAVKGTVYEIKNNQYWQKGKHVPSDGQAYCGADLTNVISKSPHGESVLSQLPKVGTYK
jgi:predicted heme/steroid binding protein